MSEALRHRRILVVEDEYVLAEELRWELEGAGAQVIGPIGHVEEALGLVQSGAVIDAAVLDVNLHGQTVFAVADLLLEKKVPLIFSTGYDPSYIPPRYEAEAICVKPESMAAVLGALGRALAR